MTQDIPSTTSNDSETEVKEFFNEFVIQTDISVSKINSFLLENDIEGGIDISANGKNLIIFFIS